MFDQTVPLVAQLGGALDMLPGLDSKASQTGEAIAHQLSTSEWLGPLAPVALSPFFGLTILSGIATYGPDWLQQRSSLFSESSTLNSPALFWCMLTLSVLSSFPRLSKLSKPFALAAENLETYSAIIILIVVRTLGSTGEVSPDAAVVGNISMIAGMPTDILLSAFAALNVVVINMVKVFCELLVWLIPFPSVDAIVELANKCVCSALLALYCFSPTAATAVNLLILSVCLLAFGAVYRRLRYYRDVIVGPLLARLLPAWFGQRGDAFAAYCNSSSCGMPRLTRVTMTRITNDRYCVSGRWLWKSLDGELELLRPAEEGLVANTLTLVDAEGKQLQFLHRVWVHGDALYAAPNSLTTCRVV